VSELEGSDELVRFLISLDKPEIKQLKRLALDRDMQYGPMVRDWVRERLAQELAKQKDN
jgi:hypothetical protein